MGRLQGGEQEEERGEGLGWMYINIVQLRLTHISSDVETCLLVRNNFLLLSHCQRAKLVEFLIEISCRGTFIRRSIGRLIYDTWPDAQFDTNP
jgi:hypothetical protein